jgi:hypothetical protein
LECRLRKYFHSTDWPELAKVAEKSLQAESCPMPTEGNYQSQLSADGNRLKVGKYFQSGQRDELLLAYSEVPLSGRVPSPSLN